MSNQTIGDSNDTTRAQLNTLGPYSQARCIGLDKRICNEKITSETNQIIGSDPRSLAIIARVCLHQLIDKDIKIVSAIMLTATLISGYIAKYKVKNISLKMGLVPFCLAASAIFIFYMKWKTISPVVKINNEQHQNVITDMTNALLELSNEEINSPQKEREFNLRKKLFDSFDLSRHQPLDVITHDAFDNERGCYIKEEQPPVAILRIDPNLNINPIMASSGKRIITTPRKLREPVKPYQFALLLRVTNTSTSRVQEIKIQLIEKRPFFMWTAIQSNCKTYWDTSLLSLRKEVEYANGNTDIFVNEVIVPLIQDCKFQQYRLV